MPVSINGRARIIETAGGSAVGWWRKGEPENVTGTHAVRALAEEFHNQLKTLPRDRPFSMARVESYEKLFEQGQFQMCTWDKAYCISTGEWYRVNGQHTSYLLLNKVSTIPDWFMITVRSWECATVKDVANLWATFDNKTQTRTSRNVYMSTLSTHDQLKVITQRMATALVGGIGYNLDPDGYAGLMPTERVENLFDHVDFCLWAHDIFFKKADSKTQTAMLRQPVTAAMFGSFKANREKAESFWQLVRDNEGFTKDVPQRRLADYLLNTRMGGGGGGRTKKDVASVREIYVRCIHAWNAWRRGTSTRLTYYPDAPIPPFAT